MLKTVSERKKIMSLIVDILVMLSVCQFINPSYITQKNHTTGITNHYRHVVEKYQLLGGKSFESVGKSKGLQIDSSS